MTKQLKQKNLSGGGGVSNLHAHSVTLQGIAVRSFSMLCIAYNVSDGNLLRSLAYRIANKKLADKTRISRNGGSGFLHFGGVMQWTPKLTKVLMTKLRLGISTLVFTFSKVGRSIRLHDLKSQRKWNRFMKEASICGACWNRTAHLLLMLLAFSPLAHAMTGTATYYTVKSCKAEGNSGIFTASGERYNEGSFTAALRSRTFGKSYRVTNLANQKSVVVRHNDFGPGKGPSARGVVIDLSPAAYDALGGKRGVTKSGISWGEIKSVKVETVEK